MFYTLEMVHGAFFFHGHIGGRPFWYFQQEAIRESASSMRRKDISYRAEQCRNATIPYNIRADDFISAWLPISTMAHWPTGGDEAVQATAW